MTKLEENIIEIAWAFRDLADTDNKIEYIGTETRVLISDLAKEFEEEYKDVDWNASNAPLYIEEIQNFTKRKLDEYYS